MPDDLADILEEAALPKQMADDKLAPAFPWFPTPWLGCLDR